MEAARRAIEDNRKPSSAGRRFWELSGGIIRCGVCGNRMQTRHYLPKGEHEYFYYRCRKYHQYGDAGCDHRKSHRADKIEAAVWEFVSGLLQQPERLQQGLDEMIKQERAAMRGDPEQAVKAWLAKVAEVEQERRGYLRLAAKGHMNDEELDKALSELEDTRKTAEGELRAIQGQREIIEQLERDRDTILEYYAGMVPKALDELTGEERHQVYRMLRLEVYVHPNGDLEIRGVIRAEVRGGEMVYPEFCTSEATPTATHKTGWSSTLPPRG